MSSAAGTVASSICLVILLGATRPLAAQAAVPVDTLTNRSVVEMVTAKLPKDLIIAKIKSTPARFDVTASGLVALNNAKVPKDIIKLMMQAPAGMSAPPALPTRPATEVPPSPARDSSPPVADSRKAAPKAPEAATAPAKPAAPSPATRRTARKILNPLPTESGIYVVTLAGDPEVLEPTVYTSAKVTGQVLSAFTNGLAPQKIKAVVRGAQAPIRFTDSGAEFYFVFENRGGSLSNSSQWWTSLSSPNEFTLVRLDAATDHREVTTASVGAFENRSGTDDKAVVAFTFTRLKPGVYRVIPRAPLAPGEYAFFPAGTFVAGTAGANRLFDFGVDAR